MKVEDPLAQAGGADEPERPVGEPEPLVLRKREPGAPAPEPPKEPPAGRLAGLTNTLPPEAGRATTLPPDAAARPRTPTLPMEAVRGEILGNGQEAAKLSQSAVAGLVATGAIHLVLVLAVVLAGRTKPRPAPARHKEMVIETRILEVQAGSAEGMRETGPAYRRRAGATRPTRRHRKEIHLGTSGRRGPRRPSAMGPTDPPEPGKDDAANVPAGWGSQTGIDAPAGAGPGDDRRGAGGTAEKGALDPCFTQHAQVVAGYRAKVAGKIPPMPRPAFISADVAENLTTLVRVAIDASGKIVSVSSARSSGNPRFDGAATAHVQAVASFPAPHKCVMYDKLKGIFRNAVTFTVSVRSR